MSGMGDFLRMEAMMDVAEGDSRDAGMLLVEASMFDQMDQQQRQQQAAEEAARQRAAAAEQARIQAEARARAEEQARREAAERALEQERQRNYEHHRNAGQSLMARSDFSGAIQEFQTALSYDSHHYMTRYDIACCYMQLRNVAAAYKAFIDLESHADQIADYAARLSACEGALIQAAGAQLKRATDSYSQQDLHTATAALAVAKGLLPSSKSAESMHQSIATLEQRIAWDGKREQVNQNVSQAIRLFEQGAIDQSLTLLISSQDAYQAFGPYLSESEVSNLTQAREYRVRVERAIEFRANRANQQFIVDNFSTLLSNLSDFDTVNASRVLNAIYQAAQRITKPEDAGPNFVAPQIWQQSLQQLEVWVRSYNQRVQQGPIDAAASLLLNRKDNAIAKLSQSDHTSVSDMTVGVLRDQWNALDQRDISVLMNNLEQVILNNLVQRNWLMSCCMAEWYVNDLQALEAELRRAVGSNLPTTPRPSITLALHSIPAAPQPTILTMLQQRQARAAEEIPLAQVVAPEQLGTPSAPEDRVEHEAKQRAVMM